jgi:hypothetical protein
MLGRFSSGVNVYILQIIGGKPDGTDFERNP